MNTMRTLVRRRPLIALFVLTFALSWLPWPLYSMELFPIPIFPFGPSLAAIILVGVSDGRAGVRELFGRLKRWRVGGRWYMGIVLAPSCSFWPSFA